MFKETWSWKIFVGLTVFLTGLISFPVLTNALQINLASKNQEVGVSEEVSVNVFLNAKEEDVNALEGELSYPRDLFDLKEIKYGNSVVTFWVEEPQMTDIGRVIFSGIIPGGFMNKGGYVFSLILKAKQKGTGSIEFINSQILLNNGEGTRAKLASLVILPAHFFIYDREPIATPEIIYKDDYDLPEEFTPEISRDQSIFNNQWFLVFQTQDKGSGIDHYEVKEGWRPFFTTESPYLLKNQNLDEEIIVKAIDRQGNKRISTLAPKYLRVWYQNYQILVILSLVTIVFVYLIGKLWRIILTRPKKY